MPQQLKKIAHLSTLRAPRLSEAATILQLLHCAATLRSWRRYLECG